MILLQSMGKVSYKMRQVFYYKMRQLLQNGCVDFISNFDSYYKMQSLLQNVLAKHLPNEALFVSIRYAPIHCVEICAGSPETVGSLRVFVYCFLSNLVHF